MSGLKSKYLKIVLVFFNQLTYLLYLKMLILKAKFYECKILHFNLIKFKIDFKLQINNKNHIMQIIL